MKILPSLAIVAGGGTFPKRIAQNAEDAGIRVCIVHLEGDSDGFSGFDSITTRPEKLGTIFAALRARHIHDLVLIGHMKRPGLFALRPDWLTLRLMGRVAWALCFGGDDALLRTVRRMLEGQGFTLHAAHDFVDGLTAPAGVFGGKGPGIEALEDIQIGIEAARAHGARDAGQAVVVLNGRIIAREDARGTDALIADTPAKGAVLVKMAKPQQDRALDLPAVGPETVRACMRAGYAGIAVEAGGTLVAEREETVALADTHGLFLIGVK